jgi:hypothetical protein
MTTATLEFPTSQMAGAFAKAWTRKTLMGHSSKGGRVEIYNVTEDLKIWIGEYLAKLNEQQSEKIMNINSASCQ